MATALESCADDLDRKVRALTSESLTLAESASESGYSTDHLSRLVREGKIPNAGRKCAPRICRRDLPSKRSALPIVADFHEFALTKDEIVRSVVTSKEEDDG